MDRPIQKNLETALGYAFKDASLLTQALTHSSVAGGKPECKWNERLEFLGDAVLSLGVSTRLFSRSENFKEGDLSKIRAALVNEAFLAGIARGLGLGDAIQLGRGERKAGLADQASILADALEAVLGAIYLDGGFDAARFVVDRLFQEELEGTLDHLVTRDFKTELQELTQSLHQQLPEYTLIDETGPAHAKKFVVAVSLRGEEMGRGSGVTKKAASQTAARVALGKFDSTSGSATS